jgi:hypothetical protein
MPAHAPVVKKNAIGSSGLQDSGFATLQNNVTCFTYLNIYGILTLYSTSLFRVSNIKWCKRIHEDKQ